MMEAAMFLMSRKQGDAIVIGGEITISVLAIRKYRVRLAIAAPPHATIQPLNVSKVTRSRARGIEAETHAQAVKRADSKVDCCHALFVRRYNSESLHFPLQ